MHKFPAIGISIFDPEKCLLGIDFEVVNLCNGKTADDQLIIDKYLTISIGIVFFMIMVRIKVGK